MLQATLRNTKNSKHGGEQASRRPWGKSKQKGHKKEHKYYVKYTEKCKEVKRRDKCKKKIDRIWGEVIKQLQ